ncbi:MAG: ion transporter [Hyphomicrobiales bacterium]|nr:ion transporter [Hyphomicrobiales bacterium]
MATKKTARAAPKKATPMTAMDNVAPGLREQVRAIIEHRSWERFITGLIIVNAITLGLETSAGAMSAAGPFIEALDTAVLAIFVAEIALRLFVYRAAFWRDPWSVFDFVVVAIALAPASGDLAVLRSLRVIRAPRLISTVQSMRRVVNGLMQAIPGMGAVIMLLLLILYIFSVMATKLYGETVPELFGTLGDSAFSLFIVMTLEGWADMARQVMVKHPSAWLFFLVFILTTSFAVLNLFIGTIVDAMQQEQEAELAADRVRDAANMGEVLNELREVKAELAAIRARVEAPR